jgi:4-hydroxybenzoate polyprenyltransferase
MNSYQLALTLGFLFFVIQFYLVYLSGGSEPGVLWLSVLTLSIIFFSYALSKKYKQEKQDKLTPPTQFVGAAKKEAKKLLIVGISLLVFGYLLLAWSGGWFFLILIPIWMIGAAFLLVGLTRFIRHLK